MSLLQCHAGPGTSVFSSKWPRQASTFSLSCPMLSLLHSHRSFSICTHAYLHLSSSCAHMACSPPSLLNSFSTCKPAVQVEHITWLPSLMSLQISGLPLSLEIFLSFPACISTIPYTIPLKLFQTFAPAHKTWGLPAAAPLWAGKSIPYFSLGGQPT